MLSPLPRRSDWGHCFAHSPQSCQPSPIWLSGRPVHRPFRGLLGVHSRYGLHTRAITVYRDTLSEGFSHFVTSIAAPVASGWSVSPGGACTHWKAPPSHGARHKRTASVWFRRGAGLQHASPETNPPLNSRKRHDRDTYVDV